MTIAIVALFAACVIGAAAFYGWYRDGQERLAYEDTLSNDQIAEMKGFCSVGHTWRDYRDNEARAAARLPGTTWKPIRHGNKAA